VSCSAGDKCTAVQEGVEDAARKLGPEEGAACRICDARFCGQACMQGHTCAEPLTEEEKVRAKDVVETVSCPNEGPGLGRLGS
jgi:hypothetical protein